MPKMVNHLIEDVKTYQPLVLKETILGELEFTKFEIYSEKKMQGCTTNKVPFTARLPQLDIVCPCIVLIYSITFQVSFIISCRNECWTKR